MQRKAIVSPGLDMIRCRVECSRITWSGTRMTPIDKPSWLLRFARQLHKIQPAMAGSVAAPIALTAYPDASDMKPEEAAEIYALEVPPGDVEAPGN